MSSLMQAKYVSEAQEEYGIENKAGPKEQNTSKYMYRSAHSRLVRSRQPGRGLRHVRRVLKWLPALLRSQLTRTFYRSTEMAISIPVFA